MKKSIISILLSIIIFGCKKESIHQDNISLQQQAIHQIKNIVGDKGNIVFTLPSIHKAGVQTNRINDTIVKMISLEEFKKLYEAHLRDTMSFKLVQVIDSANIDSNFIKSNMIKSHYDFEEGPRPAGLYRYSFSPLQNGNTSLFSNLNIAFNTNTNGSIYGTPSIYFTGINLFSWSPQQTSQISFNPSTFTSTFTITGNVVFGIQFSGGFTIGWSTTTTFYVIINMDDAVMYPVVIFEQK